MVERDDISQGLVILYHCIVIGGIAVKDGFFKIGN